jgi:uncharacterized protein (DUF1778 family)
MLETACWEAEAVLLDRRFLTIGRRTTFFARSFLKLI